MSEQWGVRVWDCGNWWPIYGREDSKRHFVGNRAEALAFANKMQSLHPGFRYRAMLLNAGAETTAPAVDDLASDLFAATHLDHIDRIASDLAQSRSMSMPDARRQVLAVEMSLPRNAEAVKAARELADKVAKWREGTR